ncbi:MAG: hypothetical protein QOI08_600 [Actinomycetota bacterium]|nr:hypothetical protein [Actinomycetota bacterium]
MMKTRTIRWLVIAFALAIPVGTMLLIRNQRDPTKVVVDATKTPTVCTDAAQLEAVDRDVAIARYRSIRDADASSGPERLCAVQALARLEPPTVADRTFLAAQSAVNWLSNRITGSDARLSSSASGPILVALFAIVGLALIVALGQFVLWRSERWPGPVAVGEIDAPKDATGGEGLAQIVKDRMASAGVPPASAAPGDVAAVVVDAVDANVAAATGWLASLLRGLVASLRPKAGFTVTGTAFAGDGVNPCCVALEAVVTRTGANFGIVTGRKDTYEAAAIDATYQLYLTLADRDEVKRRTPEWLAWTSTDGLRAYDDGTRILDRRILDRVDADDDGIAALEQAAALEPANALVLLRLAQGLWEAAQGTREADILAARTPETARAMSEAAVSALEWALRFVYRAPQSDDALFLAAIYLSYAEEWISVWATLGPERQARSARLVEDAVRRVDRRRRKWAFVALPASEDAVVARFRDASKVVTRRVIRNQRYWNVVWRALRLAQRRETRDRVLPWSRVRFNRRHAALAILEGIRWDTLRWSGRTDASAGVSAAQQTIPSMFHRFRIRVGTFVWRDPDHVVEWNLAAAYACEARARGTTEPRPDGRMPPGVQRATTRQLRKSLLGVSSRLRGSDVDELWRTPDFSEAPRGFREPMSFVRRWAVPLVDDRDPELSARAWSGAFANVSATVSTAMSVWAGRVITSAARAGATRAVSADEERNVREEVLGWFGADDALWNALTAWMAEPSASDKLAALVTMTASFEDLLSEGSETFSLPAVQGSAGEFEMLGPLIAERARASAQAHATVLEVVMRPTTVVARDAFALIEAATIRWAQLCETLIARGE